MAKREGFSTHDFRTELLKVMPGYAWIVHRQASDFKMVATGTQSSGFNRLSTLEVTRSTKRGLITYEVKSSGPGLRAPWLGCVTDSTLAKALRVLQQFYRAEAARFSRHHEALERGREPIGTSHA
ncbi:hypothetical protein [Pleomorphomonas koreensis]|uniref:hypothetical protein n=1 Tax=Pleomorphomonas koreensis TaxID=257440 RepID=UPI000A03F0FC|nr:hypothetical protein [Pleomorphomonas koreensis]